jgi:thioester reductase-like protein
MIELLTGATGFVGGAIAIELLERTDADLVCVVRPSATGTPAQRLHRSLLEAAEAYGKPHLLPDILSRSRAVAGDIAGALPSTDDVGPVDGVWHCAASLRFEDRHAAEIEVHNVAGTRAVLGLARTVGARAFNHISTAYVAGTANGEIAEETGTARGHHNHYERTKLVGERVVEAADDLHVRILRPSIVVGHSRTHAATSFTGMYGLMREIVGFRRKVARRLGDLLMLRPLRILADPDTRVNLIPVDEVARQAVAISRSAGTGTYFHLTNPCAPRLEEAMQLGFGLLGMRRPIFTASARDLNSIDQALSDRIPFYGSYLTGTKLFARGATDAALGASWTGVELGGDALRPYLDWYLRKLGAVGDRDSPALNA